MERSDKLKLEYAEAVVTYAEALANISRIKQKMALEAILRTAEETQNHSVILGEN